MAMRLFSWSGLAGALLLAACIALPNPSLAQQTDTAEEAIYVPADLDDCFVQLKMLLRPEDIAAMRDGSEEDMILYHFGLGMWLRNNWGLWGGSRLAGWFNERGIHHPDDMSGIILDSFWRHLNDRPIRLDDQIKRYQDFWENSQQPQQ